MKHYFNKLRKHVSLFITFKNYSFSAVWLREVIIDPIVHICCNIESLIRTNWQIMMKIVRKD